MRRIALLAVFCAAAAACGKVQAKTPGAVPALAMPEPPSRAVLPVSVDPPTSTPVVTEKPAPVAPPPRPSTARPTPTPAASPTPTPTPDPNPPVLQTSANPSELESRARAQLDRAKKDLARVSRPALGRDAQDQYDSAERYIKMASDAITIKNFVHASFCADKASTLLGLLIK
jgi:hypothetical protein